MQDKKGSSSNLDLRLHHRSSEDGRQQVEGKLGNTLKPKGKSALIQPASDKQKHHRAARSSGLFLSSQKSTVMYFSKRRPYVQTSDSAAAAVNLL